MICVTGKESTLSELRARQQAMADADLHELRLDLLDELPISLEASFAIDPGRLVVTCRPTWEGGKYDGDETERLEILRRAAAAGVGFVDVEAEVEASRVAKILEEASRGMTRVIRSRHLFEPGASPHREMDRLRAMRGHVLKLAYAVEDAAELEPLVEIGRERDRPLLLIGMGSSGLLSRACYRRFGSVWTFVAADAKNETAPGQLSWERAKLWGVGSAADPAPVVLLGGEQVHGSPGPAVYNQFFAERGLPWIYLPVETSRLEETLALLGELGFIGGSVTMPLKGRAAELVDRLDEDARGIGAVNTILHTDGQLVGRNTDGAGVLRALSAVTDLSGAAVLLLGAGGTARAIAWNLSRAGAKVALWNRTKRRALALLEELRSHGAGQLAVAERRREVPFDVLVNATSIGMGGQGHPIPSSISLRDKVVLDCVAQPPQTPLVIAARAQGATVVDGVQMWLNQGALQLSMWLKENVGARELESFLPRGHFQSKYSALEIGDQFLGSSTKSSSPMR